MLQKIQHTLGGMANALCAAMLAAMFATFLLQIFSRYIMQEPFGWTLELCLTLWVWIVFFGNAFIVRDKDHVTFDVFYLMAPSRLQKIFALITAAAIATGLIWAFLPTLDYVQFMGIRKSALLKIPMNIVFSVYMVFMLAVILRYLFRAISIVRYGPPPPEWPGEISDASGAEGMLMEEQVISSESSHPSGLRVEGSMGDTTANKKHLPS